MGKSTAPGVTPLSDDEEEQLSRFFARQTGPDAMNLEEMDGFFAALLAGPEMVMPAEYLPVVLGRAASGEDDDHDAAAFANLEEANATLGLIMRHWNVVAGVIDRGEIYLPLLLERDPEDPLPEGHRWARGFMRGVGMRRASWAELINDEAEAGAIVPIALLAGDVDAEWLKRPWSTKDQEELLLKVAAGFTRIHRYFAPQRRKNAALRAGEGARSSARRTTAKVGRNESCPCGSGRKYKQCCGRTNVPPAVH
jgi:uncharacterized protein